MPHVAFSSNKKNVILRIFVIKVGRSRHQQLVLNHKNTNVILSYTVIPLVQNRATIIRVRSSHLPRSKP